jgi:hypothetical protein
LRSSFYAALVTTLGLVVASCSSTNQDPSTSPSTAPPPLVGRWEQTHHCDDLVQAFDDVGLEAIAPSCKGKHPQLHFHFFTASGQFGSLDKNEQQVDDGTYEIIDAHTFQIGESTFQYDVTGGDTLTLEPVITRAQRREALAGSPEDFTTGSWMVNVAYQGTTWKRVPCEGWC